jgi:hypothetical protein
MNRQVATTFAIIDDQILDGEDSTTTSVEDAAAWTQVYAELLRISFSLQADSRSESETLQQQADMYRRRLTFWKNRLPLESQLAISGHSIHTGKS